MLKVGLIVDSEHVPQYVRDIVDWARTKDDINVSHLIIQKLPPRGNPLLYYVRRFKQRGFFSLVAAKTFRWITALERTLLARNAVYREHLTDKSIGHLVPGRLEVEVLLSPSGFVHRFSESDVTEIANLNLDLMIRCGSGILRGDVLSAARLGIVSFHHADNRVNRGGPPGFWEVYLKNAETGVTVQRLTEELDGGEVLIRGSYPTKHYYLLNQAFVFTRGNALMKKILADASKTGRLPSPDNPVPYCHPLYRLPNLSVQIRYFLKTLKRFIKTSSRRLAGIPNENWSVAYLHEPWHSAVLWRAKTIKNPSGCFLADPFAFEYNGQDYIFVEEYSYKESIGRISVYLVTREQNIRLGLALSEDFHLSFPYVFTHEGEVYMCPETSEINEIRIYRCTSFPLHWEHCLTLMKNVSAADTVIFKKDGRWWLLTNIDSSYVGDHSSELHVFYADSPITTDWKSVTGNPVISSSQLARNGGLISNETGVYRIAQKQGFCVYGQAASIRKIELLAEDGYKESATFDIDLHIKEKRRDCHHYHSNSRITVFDYK